MCLLRGSRGDEFRREVVVSESVLEAITSTESCDLAYQLHFRLTTIIPGILGEKSSEETNVSIRQSI